MARKTQVKVTGPVGLSLPQAPQNWLAEKGDPHRLRYYSGYASSFIAAQGRDRAQEYAYEQNVGHPPVNKAGAEALQWNYGLTIKGRGEKAAILRGSLVSGAPDGLTVSGPLGVPLFEAA